MTKKFSLALFLPMIVLPIANVVSCAQTPTNAEKPPEKEFLVSKNFLVDEKIQNDSNKKELIIDKNIEQEDLKKIPQNLNGFYKSPIISGGYGEERNFYKTLSGQNKKNIHLGVDVVVKENTPVISPADGKIVASYWINVEGKQEDTFANGIGGVVIAKYKISDLVLPREYKEPIYVKSKKTISKVPKMALISENKYYPLVHEKDKQDYPKEPFYEVDKEEYDNFLTQYKQDKPQEYAKQLEKQEEIAIGFIHLSKNSPTLFNKSPYRSKHTSGGSTYSFIVDKNISSENPLSIKKGDTLGYVGGFADNGYWSPHVHVNSYFYLNDRSNFFNRISKYKWNGNEDDAKVWRNLFLTRPLGMNAFVNDKVETKNSLTKSLAQKGYFDPNNIFDLYDDKTEKIYLTVS